MKCEECQEIIEGLVSYYWQWGMGGFHRNELKHFIEKHGGTVSRKTSDSSKQKEIQKHGGKEAI